jgi:hypothetical protein
MIRRQRLRLFAAALGSLPVLAAMGTVPSTVVHAATAPADITSTVPQNPHLAPNGLGSYHDDAYQSDTFPWAGPPAAPGTIQLAEFAGWCSPALFDAARRVFTTCITDQGPRLFLLDPDTLATVASLTIPVRANPRASFSYPFVDHEFRLIMPTPDRRIWVIKEVQNAGVVTLKVVKKFSLTSVVPATDFVLAILPDWSGRIWFVSRGGIVGRVDPATGAVTSTSLGESISNAPAIDETGGVFLVTTRALYRLDPAPGTGIPMTTWREPYNRGTRVKPGQSGRGSGTSPSLMGEGYVAIADNADPHVHALVYRRGTDVTGPRLVCSVPLFPAYQGAVNNAFSATDTSLVIENTYGYVDASSVTGGASTVPGISRVDLDPSTDRCEVVWTNDLSVPPAAGKLSVEDGRFYCYTKNPDPVGGTDPWTFTAVDFDTGATLYQVLTGHGTAYDDHYSSVSVAPDGTSYVGVKSGMLRIDP